MALWALSVRLRHIPTPKLAATLEVIRLAQAQAGRLEYPQHVAFAVLAMFHGFFRQCNMALARVTGFDQIRHSTRGDFIFVPGGLLVNVKWSKILQSSASATQVLLGTSRDKTLCPVRALTELWRISPTDTELQPLFQLKGGNPFRILYLADRWKELLNAARVDPGPLTLHSLCRVGAAYAHAHRANISDIMSQGTWASDSVQAYLCQDQGLWSPVQRDIPLLVSERLTTGI